ncbi:LysR family transcriptional regulator [uncultured Jatrophihabitans sp.]|uniref:LysR family transcriptional regulator n=1 Tax=uncultured Jatrophihabitans sp. TaxID=1610747 RepID=UPI0035CC219D
MQLQQLAYFVAVADTGQFTRAAHRMGVAQPSLSQQIRALEADLDAPLLHRTRGNVTLTDAGEALLPVARRILADVDAARREIRDVHDLGRGRVRLGATPSLCTGLLPMMLARFRSEAPNVQIVVHESGSRDLQNELAEGALDLALIIDPRVPDDPALRTVALLDEQLVVISSRSGPRPTRRSSMAVGDLEGRPLVMFRSGYDLRERTVAACVAAGFDPTFSVEGGEMDAVLEFVHAGLGLAVVPSTVATPRFWVTPFTPPGIRRTVLLAERADVEAPRAARALHESIVDFLQRAADTDSLPSGVQALT